METKKGIYSTIIDLLRSDFQYEITPEQRAILESKSLTELHMKVRQLKEDLAEYEELANNVLNQLLRIDEMTPGARAKRIDNLRRYAEIAKSHLDAEKATKEWQLEQDFQARERLRETAKDTVDEKERLERHYEAVNNAVQEAEKIREQHRTEA
jgi:hypothetical protein